MEPLNTESASLGEIWARVFDRVRREVDVPTVWLAMQAVKPLAIDGSFFVATLAPDMRFLGINLQSSEASLAIEEALQEATGRVLAFRLIEGQTVEDWQREKSRAEAVPSRPVPTDAPPLRPPTSSTGAPSSYSPHPDREIFPTWEKLNDRLVHGIKAAPLMKYPQGQAAYIMRSIEMVSDTMDILMPGLSHDEAQERTLAKTLERLGSVVNLDPLFLGLELFRYRRNLGKDIGS